MSWFWIALIAPLFWAVTNHIDKYIISNYFKSGSVGSVVLFTTFFDIITLPLILLFNNHVFSIQPLHALVLVLVGIISTIELTIYLYALDKSETSIVVPLFQMIPVLTYFTSFFILGETLSLRQILASLLIIGGAVVLSLDLTEKIPKFRAAVFWLMFLASLLVAIIGVIFKLIALEETFWISTFWAFIGGGITGIFIFIFIKSFRIHFLTVVKRSNGPLWFVNIANEVLNEAGNLLFSYATLLAPVALVYVVNGFQPVFVLIFGVMLTLFFPKYGNESLLKKDLIQKIGSVVVIFLGTILLNV